MLFARFALAGLAVLTAGPSPLDAEWKALGPFGGSIQLVALDARDPDLVIAGTSNALLFRSRSGGASWSALRFPAELRATLHALAIDPVRTNTYFAGVSSELPEHAGVFRTRDAGTTWEQLPGMRNQQVWSLALSAADTRVLAAGTEAGLYVTADGGETWHRLSPESNRELRPVVSIAYHPTDRNIVFAGTPHLAWKTTDGGATWKSIRTGMRDDSDVFSIVLDQKQPAHVFAGACSGIYRSLDGGATWMKLSGARGASYRTYFVAQHPALSNILYAGTASGLIQSVDSGTTWRQLTAHAARGMALDASHPGRMFVATEDAGVLRSDDGGIHLVEANQGLCSRHLSPLVESGGDLLSSVLGEKGRRGAMKLSSAASSWEEISRGGGLPEIRYVVPFPGAPDQIYALAGAALLRSQDAGRSWMRMDAPGHLTSLIAPQGEFGGLLAVSEGSLFLTADGGKTWHGIDLPETGLPIRKLVALSLSAVAALAGSRVLLSLDGLRWKVASELPGNPEIHGLAANGSGGLLAATAAGLMRSDDFGDSWRVTGRGLAATAIEAIASDPARDGRYFAAVSGMVYESVDAGESWRAVAAQGSGIDRIIQLLPATRGLLALTEARGVFQLESGAKPAAELAGGASRARP